MSGHLSTVPDATDPRRWPAGDSSAGAGYHLQSVAYSVGAGGWVGVWLDTALGFRRDLAVTLHAPTRDQLRILAAYRGLPWPDLDGGTGGEGQ